MPMVSSWCGALGSRFTEVAVWCWALVSRDLHQTAPVLVPRDWMLIRGWSAGVVLLETISSFPFTQREKGNPNKKNAPWHKSKHSKWEKHGICLINSLMMWTKSRTQKDLSKTQDQETKAKLITLPSNHWGPTRFECVANRSVFWLVK